MSQYMDDIPNEMDYNEKKQIRESHIGRQLIIMENNQIFPDRGIDIIKSHPYSSNYDSVHDSNSIQSNVFSNQFDFTKKSSPDQRMFIDHDSKFIDKYSRSNPNTTDKKLGQQFTFKDTSSNRNHDVKSSQFDPKYFNNFENHPDMMKKSCVVIYSECPDERGEINPCQKTEKNGHKKVIDANLAREGITNQKNSDWETFGQTSLHSFKGILYIKIA